MTARRRLGIAGASALAVFALVGCTTDTPAPTVTVTAAPSAPVSPPVSPQVPVNPGFSQTDIQYLDALHERVNFPTSLDAKAVELGNIVCDALDTGVQKTELIPVFEDSGFTTDEGITFIAAAVVYYCPEYSEANQSGYTV